MKHILFVILIIFFTNSTNGQLMVKRNQQIIDSLKKQPLRLVTENYYSNNLGFICKKEIQFEKSTKIPLKFRLGNIEYVDKIEGKGFGRN